MLLRLFFVLVLCVVAQGCEKDETPLEDVNGPALERGDSTARTVLAYIMAENSLASNVVSDLREMKKGISSMPDNCCLLAFVDGVENPYICRFYNSKLGESVCDTVYMFEEDFYSTDSAKFKDVLLWTLQEYPTNSLGLVMWSHGTGWLYDKNKTRSIGVDNGKNVYADIMSTSRWMEIEELAYVLNSLPVKKDFVFFDACFMQCVEVAYAMRESAEWIIGSPAELPADGAPYDKIMSYLFSFPFDAKGLIESYKAGYSDNNGVVLSAVKSSEVEALAEATAAFVPAFFSADSLIDDSSVFTYCPGGRFTDLMEYPEYCDMNGQMMLRLPEDAYLVWKDAFDAAVPYKIASRRWYSGVKHSYLLVDILQYGGLSMYVPRNNSKFSTLNKNFKRTEWYQAAGWERTGW
ncbi:MAG: hypothetical protein IIV19_03470 [Bacteroidaceae bacterium]|nr:hypothetical protein [Bacteroidaceae bacterium]